MDDNDTCVCCGQYAGEGRQVCMECEKGQGSIRVESGTMSFPEFALAKRVLELEQVVMRLRWALTKIYSVGHNEGCLFCGFKDRAAGQALEGGGE